MSGVEVAGLTVRYRRAERDALREVSLAVAPGELVGVLGATGSGKTTLCRALSGVVPHGIRARVEGRVVVDGAEVAATSAAALAAHCGTVFQDAESQVFGLTVESDVAFGMENLGWPPETIRARVDEALARVRLDGLAARPSFELSGGQKQRLVVASALAMRPPVLVLDEPTGELDPVGRQELMGLLRQLADDGVAVLVAEQATDELAEVAQRVVLLREGGVVADGPAGDVLGDPELLGRCGVRLPEVARCVSAALPDVRPLPVTVDAAARRLGRRAVPGAPGRRTQPAPASGTPAVEVLGLSFGYDTGRPALQEVSLRVDRGEMVALVGENGAGKSTLVRQLNGLLRPDSGRVLVDGRDAAGSSVAQLSRQVGFVFQNPDHQIFAETVRDELAFGPRNADVPDAELEERMTRSLRDVRLGVDLDTHPGQLGAGERQQLAIASVLTMEPTVLVVDEPTTGLDDRVATSVMELLRGLNRQGRTVLLVTHDMSLVATYVDRVVVLAGGRVLRDGDTRSVLADEHLLGRAYLRPPPAARLAALLGLQAATPEEVAVALDGQEAQR